MLVAKLGKRIGFKLRRQYCEMILPKMVSETELMDYLNINSVEKNMGACMKALKSEFGANMDGRIASMVAKNYINS